MAAWLDTLLDRIRIWRGRRYVIVGVFAYLCWCKHIQDHPEHALQFGNPYEPLIRFLESGGEIYVEHGIFLTVYPSSVSMMIHVELEASE